MLRASLCAKTNGGQSVPSQSTDPLVIMFICDYISLYLAIHQNNKHKIMFSSDHFLYFHLFYLFYCAVSRTDLFPPVSTIPTQEDEVILWIPETSPVCL